MLHRASLQSYSLLKRFQAERHVSIKETVLLNKILHGKSSLKLADNRTLIHVLIAFDTSTYKMKSLNTLRCRLTSKCYCNVLHGDLADNLTVSPILSLGLPYLPLSGSFVKKIILTTKMHQ